MLWFRGFLIIEWIQRRATWPTYKFAYTQLVCFSPIHLEKGLGPRSVQKMKNIYFYRLRMTHLKKSFLFFLAAVVVGGASAQKEGTIVASGSTKTYGSGKKLTGVHVVLNSALGTTTISTDDKGRFETDLAYNQVYQMKFEKEGLVSKTLLIDTRGIPAAEQQIGFFYIPFKMSLFEVRPDMDVSLLNRPIASYIYDSLSNDLVYDPTYTESIKDSLYALIQDLDRRLAEEEKLLAQRRAEEEARNKAIVALREKTAALIEEGDIALAQDKLESALKSFNGALALDAENNEAKKKADLVANRIRSQEEAEAAKRIAEEAEVKRLAEELRLKQEQELAAKAAAKTQLEQQKLEEERLAEEERRRIEAEKLAGKEAELAAKEQERIRLEREKAETARLAEEERIRIEAEKLASKEAELAAKETERLRLEKEKAEADRLAEQERLKILAEKQKMEEALAKQKEDEKARLEAEKLSKKRAANKEIPTF